MNITEISICEMACLLEDSVELMDTDHAAVRCHILQHPELGNVTVFQGSGGGFLVQNCPDNESTHHHAQSVLSRVY